jgi:chromosome segregation ATPase
LNNENASKQQQIDHFARENDHLAAKVAALSARLDPQPTSALQVELEQLLIEKSELASEILGLKSAVKLENQNRKREKATAAGQIRLLESELMALREQTQASADEANASEGELNEMRIELQAQFEEMQELKRALASEVNQNESLRTQLQQAVSMTMLISETEKQAETDVRKSRTAAPAPAERESFDALLKEHRELQQQLFHSEGTRSALHSKLGALRIQVRFIKEEIAAIRRVFEAVNFRKEKVGFARASRRLKIERTREIARKEEDSSRNGAPGRPSDRAGIQR